jgi:hypothetical protein
VRGLSFACAHINFNRYLNVFQLICSKGFDHPLA